jgi:DnaK suppressor protein
MMTARELAQAELLRAERTRAGQRIAALEREFADLAAAGAAGTDDEHDPEGATLAFERQHSAALLDAARDQLAAIDAALQRLETGRYGRCERCGQPIGEERLAARPAAVTCIRCAAMAQR